MCRELAKAVQNELAEANTVAEESLSSMATVRSHAAEDSARAAYQHRLRLFYRLCVRLLHPLLVVVLGRAPVSGPLETGSVFCQPEARILVLLLQLGEHEGVLHRALVPSDAGADQEPGCSRHHSQRLRALTARRRAVLLGAWTHQ